MSMSTSLERRLRRAGIAVTTLILMVACSSENTLGSESEASATDNGDSAASDSASSGISSSGSSTSASATSTAASGADADTSAPTGESTSGAFEECEVDDWQLTVSYELHYGTWPVPDPTDVLIEADCVASDLPSQLDCTDETATVHQLSLELWTLSPTVYLMLEPGEPIQLLHRKIGSDEWTVFRRNQDLLAFVGVEATSLLFPDEPSATSPIDLELVTGLCPPDIQLDCGEWERAAVAVTLGDVDARVFDHQAKVLESGDGNYHIQVGSALVPQEPRTCDPLAQPILSFVILAT